jgi:hypothetical protein
LGSKVLDGWFDYGCGCLHVLLADVADVPFVESRGARATVADSRPAKGLQRAMAALESLDVPPGSAAKIDWQREVLVLTLPDPEGLRAQLLARTLRTFDVDVLLNEGTVRG